MNVCAKLEVVAVAKGLLRASFRAPKVAQILFFFCYKLSTSEVAYGGINLCAIFTIV